MSVEDVCELGSLLQSGDKEKEMLERKLIELDGGIQNQDRRLNHEVEAEQAARNDQCNLLEGAINVSNCFEISSSVIAQLEADVASTKNLSDILGRVKAYIALRDDLADDIGSVHNEIERLQAASRRLESTETRVLPSAIGEARKLLASNEAVGGTMEQSLLDIKDDIGKKMAQIEEKLVVGASNISNNFQHIDQRRMLVDGKMKDLQEKAAAERLETESVLSLLEKARTLSALRVAEVDLERGKIAEQMQGVISAIEKDEILLKASEEENALLLKNSEDSSEAECATAKELEDAKVQLNELEKFASDKCDELSRIRRAQTFEKVREEAFVNSQSGNASSVQQICTEADRLRASLELVREEIALVKQQISSDGCEGAEGAVHQELLALQGARKSYRTRSETASARVLVSTQESVRLTEQHSAVSAEIAAAAVQRDELQSTHQALVAKNQSRMERIREITEEKARSLHCTIDLNEVIVALKTELVELSALIEVAESEGAAAEEHCLKIRAATVAHTENLLSYNAEKERQFERSEKEKRLRLSRQEKLSNSDRILQLLQEELNQEDDKFKEAIKSAENSAKITEEKLVTTMNQVIEVGLQLVAERNSKEKECKEAEAAVKLADLEHEEQLAALAKVVARESAAAQGRAAAQTAFLLQSQSQRDRPRPATSRGRIAEKATARSLSQPSTTAAQQYTPAAEGRRRFQEERSEGVEKRLGQQIHSPSQLQNGAAEKSWGSSSPASILPRKSQSQSDEEEAEGEDEVPLTSVQPNKRRYSEQSQQVKHNQDRRRNTIGGTKSKGEAVMGDAQITASMTGSTLPIKNSSGPSDLSGLADMQQGKGERTSASSSSGRGSYAGKVGSIAAESRSDKSIPAKETNAKQKTKRNARGNH